MARAKLTPQQRRRALLILGLVIIVVGGGVVGLTFLLGHEVGEPCRQGAFACRATHGLNSNRCLHETPTGGYCSYTCAATDECPPGWSCEAATWHDGDRSGRTETVCVRP